MGKIKDFVTGIFSKKDDKDEILQLQPASDPDRDLVEYENRYETPDYQAFLNDMGYIDRSETRNAPAEEQDMDPDTVLEAGSFEEDADKKPEDSARCEAAEDNTCCEATEISVQLKSEEEQSLCEVDQDFIDEGVAELGVNDVWPEEEG